MQQQALEGGFSSPPTDAAHAFRAVMNAMAQPGKITQITGAEPPSPMSIAAGTVLLTLCDPETPIFLGAHHDTPAIRDWIAFHTGAPIVGEAKAMFAVGQWSDLSTANFAIGTPEYPDRSATLIVEMSELSDHGPTLRGPGIKDSANMSLPDMPIFQSNAALFPLGLDFIFTCGDRLAGLPRTTKVS